MDLDCQSCGACCGHEWEIVVESDENVPARYLRSVRDIIGFASYEADYLKRMNKPNGVCAALGGNIGEACSCKIYDRRPAACREFAPGSPDCAAARLAAGFGQEPVPGNRETLPAPSARAEGQCGEGCLGRF